MSARNLIGIIEQDWMVGKTIINHFSEYQMYSLHRADRSAYDVNTIKFDLLLIDPVLNTLGSTDMGLMKYLINGGHADSENKYLNIGLGILWAARQGENKDTPIITFSKYDSIGVLPFTHIEEDCLDAGADMYIPLRGEALALLSFEVPLLLGN